MATFFCIISCVYYTFASLQHGGQVFEWRRWADNALWFVPMFVFSVIVTTYEWIGDNPSILWLFFLLFISIAVAGLCTAGKATGHGQYFSLGNSPWNLQHEKIDPIVGIFWGNDPRLDAVGNVSVKRLYWRCATGLAIKGLLTGLCGAILMAMAGYVQSACFIAIGGLLFPVGYMIGWIQIVRDFLVKRGYGPNVLGEAVSGAAFGFFFSLAVNHFFYV